MSEAGSLWPTRSTWAHWCTDIRVCQKSKSISDYFALLVCFGSMISKVSPKNWTVPTKIEWPQPLFRHAFPFSGEYKANFQKIVFRGVLEPFYPLKSQKLKSGYGHSILVEIVQFFGTVLWYHRPKTYQKSKVVWDTFAFLTHLPPPLVQENIMRFFKKFRKDSPPAFEVFWKFMSKIAVSNAKRFAMKFFR